MLSKFIKAGLAVLFFLCLLDMPYGFYQLVRFIALVGFAILAYLEFQQKNGIAVILFMSLALLFQPFFKVALGREIWNIVDAVVGVGLLVSLFSKKGID